ncbi:MAG: four helix bundle protein [Hyphomonadaceae bacterium]
MGREDANEHGPSVWDLVVFQKAYQAALDVHRLAMSFPAHERFELTSQIRRSSKGICANLAEGRGRQQASSAEFRRFVAIALGSTDETLLWCRFARDLGYISTEQHQQLERTYGEIARMLNGLLSRLR